MLKFIGFIISLIFGIWLLGCIAIVVFCFISDVINDYILKPIKRRKNSKNNHRKRANHS